MARAAGAPRLAPDAPDADVVARAREGDRDAFRILVERYQGRAYRLAVRVLRDEEQAKDVVQDAFIKVHGALDRFAGRSSFYTWLYRVVMNLCIDAKRRDRSDRRVEWDENRALDAASDPVAASALRPDPGPAQELERAELRAAIARAIEALPEDARRTLLLREVDGLSYAEIARGLGIPKGTVMSRLHHARKRVRAALVAEGMVDSQAPDSEREEEP